MRHEYTSTPDGPMLIGASPARLAELLTTYEALVSKTLPDLRSRLLPGLAKEDVSATLRGHGLPPTPELIVLYGWANGTNWSAAPGYPLPWFPFESLERTFPRYDMAPPPPGFSFGAEEGWLRIVADNVGCAVELTESSVSRIHFANPEFEDEPDFYRAVSLCTLVAWWIEGLEAGAYTWNGETSWDVDRSLLPELQLLAGW